VKGEIFMMKRGVIFDMDGTLVDTEKIYRRAWIETADFFGVERKPDLAVAMSGSGVKQMPSILRRFYTAEEVDADKYIAKVFERVVVEAEKNLEVKSGVEEILQYFFENKIPMAVASSSETFIIEKRVKKLGWEKYFSVLVGGDQIKNSKPAPDIFILAAEKIKIAPTDCYVFEDSFNGVRAGAAAKCSTIMVIDCAEPTEEIKNLCTAVFDNMLDALNAIKRGEV